MKYPSIGDIDFQKKIAKIFKKYKITKLKSFNEYCFSKFGNQDLQLSQAFVKNYISPETKYKSLLLMHGLGSGKTCASISITENFVGKKNIILVTQSSLLGNYYKELIFPTCSGYKYISKKEYEDIHKLNPASKEYNNIIDIVYERINKVYNIMSYNKFVSEIKKRKINNNYLKNSIIVIDEVQNIVSEKGSYYKIIKNMIDNSPDELKIILLSATPIFDKPIELGLTFNLLKPKEELPIKEFNNTFMEIDKNMKYNIINEDLLKEKMIGYISYYKGAPKYTYPERKNKIIKCPMSEYQYSCYKTVENSQGGIPNSNDIFKLPNNFLLGLRMISNIAFPNKKANQKGYDMLSKTHMKLDNLQKYSSKMYELMNKLINKSGLHFVYSNFRKYGGLQSVIKILNSYGFKDFLEHGGGKLRYAIWSGDEKLKEKELIRNVFNNKDNYNGSLIKIILGSPAIKEGVTLLRVRYVHVLEPYWNMSRYEQVIGRAIRFCSHKDLPKEKRIVKVFLYLATLPDKIKNKIKLVDEHIYDMALQKNQIISKFENVIKESAIDYYLFDKANK